MTITFNTLFGQRDVRETATADAGTKYLGISPSTFTTTQPDVDNILFAALSAQAQANGIITLAPVIGLPDGATITAAIVYGNAGATAETYQLVAMQFDGSTNTTIGSGNIGTEDTSISGNGTIVDNSVYHYAFVTSSIDTSDQIWGARVTYTI